MHFKAAVNTGTDLSTASILDSIVCKFCNVCPRTTQNGVNDVIARLLI